MKRTVGVHILALLALLVAAQSVGHTQTSATDTRTLRERIERRFDVLPLRDGVALRPRDLSRDIRSIEITGGPVAIDGQPATGAELREKLGADADLVLELSYLSDEQRRTMFENRDRASQAVEPAPAERASDRSSRRSRSRGGDKVRIGGGISVGEDEVVEGNVVAIGGGARIDGEVRGDVVAVGGGVTLGPKATVTNNVVVVGGGLHRDPAARIGGQVQEIGLAGLDLGRWRFPSNPLGFYWGSMVGSAFALIGTLTRLAILCLLAALVLLMGRSYAERAGDRAAVEPLKAGAIGVFAQVLFIPVLVITIVVLVVTIVGIPLLLLIPFLLLGLAVVGLVGFTGVAQRIGHVVCERMGWAHQNPYVTTVIGVAIVLSPALLARLVGLAGGIMFPMTFGLGLIAALIEYLVWTVGFGAVALARFSRRPSGVEASPTATV